MRKVHLISVTEPLVLDLALALREKGYEVSASGCGLTEEMIGRLHNAGCTCYGDGWFPEKLIKDIHSVVLGAKVKQITRNYCVRRNWGVNPIHSGIYISTDSVENSGCCGG